VKHSLTNLAKKGSTVERKELVVLEGDGTGIEVVQATCTLLKKAGHSLDITKEGIRGYHKR
jgi:isocitrate/isopropylmalate dehydrogenase